MEYWINSNSGDFISLVNDKYKIHLIARYDEYNNYIQSECFEITAIQFKSLKGFIPIKPKKLQTRLNRIYSEARFRPTTNNGEKGSAKRVEVPTVEEARDIRLKELGL